MMMMDFDVSGMDVGAGRVFDDLYTTAAPDEPGPPPPTIEYLPLPPTFDEAFPSTLGGAVDYGAYTTAEQEAVDCAADWNALILTGAAAAAAAVMTPTAAPTVVIAPPQQPTATQQQRQQRPIPGPPFQLYTPLRGNLSTLDHECILASAVDNRLEHGYICEVYGGADPVSVSRVFPPQTVAGARVEEAETREFTDFLRQYQEVYGHTVDAQVDGFLAHMMLTPAELSADVGYPRARFSSMVYELAEEWAKFRQLYTASGSESVTYMLFLRMRYDAVVGRANNLTSALNQTKVYMCLIAHLTRVLTDLVGRPPPSHTTGGTRRKPGPTAAAPTTTTRR